jgi:beta-glucuronidase
MRIPLSATIVAATVALVPAGGAHAAPAAKVLHAAPHGAGIACSPGHPCSLSTAIDDIAGWVARGRAVTVRLAGGTYRRTTPVRLTAAMSGTPDRPVTLTAEPGARPVLSGGARIGGWHLVDPAAGRWQATWRGQTGSADRPRQLFVDGTRAELARGDACARADCAVTETGLTGTGAATVAGWRDPADVTMVAQSRWRSFHCDVAGVAGDDLVMAQPCWRNGRPGTGRVGPGWDASALGGSSYHGVQYFENAPELLDRPGEFVSASDGTLTYLARPGEDPRTADIEVPVTEQLLVVDGTPDAPVHDVTVRGIAFAYAAWDQPGSGTGYDGMQAGLSLTGTGPTDHSGRYYTKPQGAVTVRAGHRVTLAHDTFAHLAGAGVVLEHGCQHCTVRRGVFDDLSSGGVYVGDTDPHPSAAATSAHNTVSGSTFHGIGTEFTDAVGIWSPYDAYLTIDHNTLEHLPYSAISVGWGWNQPQAQDTPLRGNRITNNRLIDVMRPEAGQHDGGAIYTQGTQPGTVISGNYVDRSDYPKTDGEGANGIYLDEQSSYILVEHNVLTRISYKWVSNWAGYGIENTVTHNWSSTTAPPLSGTGSTLVDNQEGLTVLPSEAIAVARAAGANPPGQVDPL